MDYSGKIIKKTPVVPTQQSASGVWSLDEALQATKSNTWPVANVPNPISRSLRFRSSASAYLNRTPTTAGNRQRFTVSMWVKRGGIEGRTTLISAGTSSGGSGPGGSIYFNNAASSYRLELIGAGGTSYFLSTTQVFRDPSSWYHLVFAFDTTQATVSERIKVYVNGSQVTSFSSATYPSQNFSTDYNNTAIQAIGSRTDDGTPPVSTFDGYMTETIMVDGQALTPSSFGGTNATTGVWEPRQYTGTYGTNGFYLNFKDNTSTSTLGLDYSGNSNNWTTNNISLTAGSTYDSMLDVPTQWVGYNTGDVASVTRGNYATLNPLTFGGTVSEANLRASNNADYSVLSTIGATGGKFYWELVLNNGTTGDVFGINSISSKSPTETSSRDSAGFWGVTNNGTNNWFENGVAVSKASAVPTITAGQIVQIAVDTVNNKYWIGVNNSWFLSGDPAAGTNPVSSNLTANATWLAYSQFRNASSNITYNFGQRPFTYTPPAGFRSLCTTNLPSPTILQGDDYFNAVLYSGTQTTRAVTGVGFQPDFVWTKSRNIAQNHTLFNSVVGATKFLGSNTTSAESTNAETLKSFDADGYTLGNAFVNESGYTYVGWAWRASNAAGVSNTAGSITSTVSANTTSGFSIVTYTGTGANATVGHGLGVAPSWIVAKVRNASGESWGMYHVGLTSAANAVYLNLTQGQESAATQWNSTAPTSSVFSIGTNARINGNTNTFVAYCFAAVAGYSAFGRYTGTGSSDGAFVYTGFRPRYVMFMRTDTTGGAAMVDSARDPFNVAGQMLYAYGSDAEGTNPYCDLVSNGFKVRGTSLFMNASGGTYIYMAFAESPFKNALAR